MIKFNNYPPTQAGDVELTDGARKQMRLQAMHTYTEDQHYSTFVAFGMAVGHTIYSSNELMQQLPYDRARSYGGELMKLVFEDIASTVDSIDCGLSRGFENGFNKAIGDEALDAEMTGRAPMETMR